MSAVFALQSPDSSGAVFALQSEIASAVFGLQAPGAGGEVFGLQFPGFEPEPVIVSLAASIIATASATAQLSVSAVAAVSLSGVLSASATATSQLAVMQAGSVMLSGSLQAKAMASAGLQITPASTINLSAVARASATMLGALSLAPQAQVLLAGTLRTSTAILGALRVVPTTGPTGPLVGYSSELRTVFVTDDSTGLQAKFEKQPREALDYRVDVSQWCRDCNDVAVSATFDSDMPLMFGSIFVADGYAVALVSGGQHGEKIKITCTIRTAGGRSKEVDFQLRVKER